MKTIKKQFNNVVEEEKWLAEQTGTLIKTNHKKHDFKLNNDRYYYEYVFLENDYKDFDAFIDDQISVAYKKYGWAIFKKKQEDGPINLYGSLEKKITAYKSKYKTTKDSSYLMLVPALSLSITSIFSMKIYAASALCFYLSSLHFSWTASKLKRDIEALESLNYEQN